MIALVVLINLESLRAPMEYQPFRGIPGIYKLLATEPGPVVLAEQPFFPRQGIFLNGAYVLASTAHWRPLMNGYSGYTPESYQRYADAFWYFPTEGDPGDEGRRRHPRHGAPGRRFTRTTRRCFPVLENRPDFELMAHRPRRHAAVPAEAVDFR